MVIGKPNLFLSCLSNRGIVNRVYFTGDNTDLIYNLNLSRSVLLGNRIGRCF